MLYGEQCTVLNASMKCTGADSGAFAGAVGNVHFAECMMHCACFRNT